MYLVQRAIAAANGREMFSTVVVAMPVYTRGSANVIRFDEELGRLGGIQDGGFEDIMKFSNRDGEGGACLLTLKREA